MASNIIGVVAGGREHILLILSKIDPPHDSAHIFLKVCSIPWISVLGECVISLVLSCHNKDLKWRTKVLAWLQLTVLFVKQRIGNPGGVRAGWPQKRGLNPS